jgi:hypothetical protein
MFVELGRIGKEVVLAYLMVQSQHLHGGAEKNHMTEM